MDGRRRPRRTRTRLRLGFLTGAALAAIATVVAPAADAHALLSSSDPAVGATLAHSPSRITITFTEAPDPVLSTIQVLDTSGHVEAGGHPAPAAGQPATLGLPVADLAAGVYTVNWRTVSKVDGHLAAGAYSFGVGVAPTGTAASASAVGRGPRPSGLAVAARWVYFAGLIGLLGLIFTELVTLAPHTAPRRLRVAAGVAWLVGVAGAVGITEAQRRAAHLPVGRLLGSSLGHGLGLRVLPLALAGALLLLTARAPRGQRLILAGVGAATALAMLGDADSGHAAASPRWEWSRVGSQWLHFAAVGIWIGGLAGLLLCLTTLAPEERRAVARRYSTVAALALLVVVISGGLRAVDEIGSWHQLFHTGFGQLVVIKIGLLGGLVVLGALNRFRSVPAAGSRPSMLRRLGGAELGVVAVALIATAVLLNLAPSRSSAAATAPAPVPPLVVDAHDAATTVRLHLTVTPGTAGFNQFRLTVVDYDTRAPVDGATVSLRFTLPARADLGDSTLPLRPAGPGTYTAQGPNLSIDGAWTVSVLVQRPTGAVEVPVTITPRVPPQDITVQRYIGTPDISTLHLPGNRAVQVYLDPGRTAVRNEFHVTVIGPDNNELATDSVTVTATGPGGGPPANLTVRRLDPVGHFVADLARATPGRYTFDMNATTTQGDTIHGVFTATVGP